MSTGEEVLLNFGARIRALRLDRGLSQEGLAALAGMDRTYVSSIERGHRNVSLANIVKLARALHVTMCEVFDGIDG